MKRLAVYCGSASPADPRYLELAEDVGTVLAQRKPDAGGHGDRGGGVGHGGQ